MQLAKSQCNLVLCELNWQRPKVDVASVVRYVPKQQQQQQQQRCIKLISHNRAVPGNGKVYTVEVRNRTTRKLFRARRWKG